MRIAISLLSLSLIGCYKPTKIQEPPAKPTEEAPAPDPVASLLPADNSLQEAPSEVASLDESINSAPEWADPYPVSTGFDPWFEPASHSGALERDLLLCRFQAPTRVFRGQRIGRSEDTRLRVAMTLPSGKKLSFWHGKTGHVSDAMLPLFELKPGNKLKLEFYDSGFVGGLVGLFVETEASSEKLGTITVSYDGTLPLSQRIVSSNSVDKGGELSVECRGHKRSEVEAKISEEMSKADKSFIADSSAPFGRGLPLTTGFDAGYTRSTIRQMELSLEDLAALLGWSDPRVKGRADVIGSQRVLWDNKLRELLPKSGATVKIGRRNLEAQLISVTKKPATKNKKAKLQCTVELLSTGEEGKSFGRYGDLAAYIEQGGEMLEPKLVTVDGKPYKDDTEIVRDQERHTVVFELEKVEQPKIFCVAESREDCAAFWIYDEVSGQ